MHDNSIVCAFLYIITKYGYPPPAEKSLEYLQEMKNLGFQSVELEGIREIHLSEMVEIKDEIKHKADELGLEIPYYCTVLPGLASDDPKERERNLELFTRGCDTAVALGAKGVLDNAPLPPYQFPKDIPVVRHYDEDVLLTASFPKDLNWNRYWQEMVATFRDACDIAADRGLTYQMHPCLGVLSATTDAFLYFHDAVGRDNLRFNLDTANQFVMKDNIFLSLRRLKDHIDYIHLSDNRGNRVEHLAPGKGMIHWPLFFETLDAINYKGHIGLDIGGDESGVQDIDSAYQQAAQWLKKYWL
ncbi:TIM barrel protein [candidate division KSB1 bacterium]|nr:TIM barrel protein [candidate division KSB1 bacterium]